MANQVPKMIEETERERRLAEYEQRTWFERISPSWRYAAAGAGPRGGYDEGRMALCYGMREPLGRGGTDHP